MQAGEKSTTTLVIVGILAFGFLFGALFPLINNGLRVGTAGKEMSGAATGMKQKELDSRLSKVPAFAVTDDSGKPYVAEIEGQNRGFFFLDPDAAETYASRVRELNKAGASVGVRPTTLDAAIKYVKESQSKQDPFEIVPISEQVKVAEAIKSPDTCDICWGTEGVKKKVPVFWVEGLGLQAEDSTSIVTPVFFDQSDAAKFWKQINPDKEPKIEVFDLSALIKKMKKGGTMEFRKVSFYPSRKAVETAAAKMQVKPIVGAPPTSKSVFPADKST